ncbi:polyphosphate kinase 2 family protein [Dyadobacter fanqingshengii]|uniref:Polyphosphate kinase 2 family protein n=1 Tax=Dyadobacter fanqingshengii TaxID=2906443 RepID=A0A9X1T8G8_9BACT|nr:polyphosphate kinase 2 family protein [Dyadobacter fanqingshengii]MCF0038884.1 polyphosphate kinase 2 family protein [Dyadobacter fanqingshengii]USJ34292.1 polyphosphate kinase 2 family protein [Dyadobacter fanqingshengii]
MPDFNSDEYRVDGTQKFQIKKAKTRFKDIYKDKEEYETMQAESAKELDVLQSMMYAHNRYGLLVIFQAMDAAGKDGTIKHVLAGVNPVGVKIHSFKRPTETELEHDYLWRSNLVLPQRGTITIFNRSYYEEVLVAKVNPEIVTSSQRLPAELTADMDKLWKHRYSDIRNLEKYLYRNGIRVIKFFLNVSKEEQASRLIERIEDPSKNWKFEEQDVKVRGQWDEYMQAYEDCINNTATKKAPWYVMPADDKKNLRLTVSKIIVEELKKMDMAYPESGPERSEELHHFIDVINAQNSAG